MEQSEVKDLFTETKTVIVAYKAQVEELDKQEQELKADLEELQLEMTGNILEQEIAPISECIYLKIKNKEIVSKAEIIGTLLEELSEDRTALKLSFVPLLQQTLREDRKVINEYEATKVAEKYRYLMLKEIAETGKQCQSQFSAVAPDIYEVFEDQAVKEEFPRIEYSFHQDQYRPFFGWFEPSVVSKNDVNSATRGVLPAHLKAPKDVE
ncbi:hypothetical protein GKZ89_08845 [Bacillus mangrovi]|uniref:Uncharacterized protein n=1 Tax=Metabacillus mangrovi TaxID=1491830 RepID=A0A7X2S4K1_9BACI|nr:hypothetical protein [Metabacillus mangrovi]MTH53524.1 hypothetical protein [Metabacillus mangrovi]